MTPPRVILLNQTNPNHPGCRLTCDVLTRLIGKYGVLVASYPTPRPETGEPQVDYSGADVVVINGEGTMHHHSSTQPRYAPAALHRQAVIAKERGLRVALVNTLLQEFDEDLSVYDYISTRESLSHAQAIGRGARVADLAVDACFHRVVDPARLPTRRRVLVTDSVLRETSDALRAVAEARGWEFVRFKGQSPDAMIRKMLRARLVVTGRYHGAVFAIMTRTPAVCVSSNSHKIEGFLKDFGIPGCLLDDLRHVPDTAPLSPVELPPLADRVEASIRRAVLGTAWDALVGDQAAPRPRYALPLGPTRRRIRKLLLPRRYRHHTRFPFGFLRPMRSTPQYRRIQWRGETVGMLRPLARLRNTDARDCFIVATGPSLETLDLAPLRGRLCIAVNGAVVKFRQMGFAPDYFVVVDKDFVHSRFNLVGQALACGAQCVMPSELLLAICEREPRALGGVPLYLMDMIGQSYGRPALDAESRRLLARDPDILLHPLHADSKTPVGFSKDLEKGRFLSLTVVHPALQLAYYLGSRRVFILGMDLSSPPEGPIRFYEKRADARPSRIEQDLDTRIIPSFEMVREVNRHERFEVYNVCPTSKLPEQVLPRISMEQVKALLGSHPPAAALTQRS